MNMIDIATGKALDMLGDIVRLIRVEGETDVNFRSRIRHAANVQLLAARTIYEPPPSAHAAPTIRMVLGAPAVQALLGHDPTGTAELAKNAAAQVAQEIIQRVTGERIAGLKARVQEVIERELFEGNYSQTKLREPYKAIILNGMREAGQKFVDALTGGALQTVIASQVQAELDQQESVITERLSSRIDALLRERFAAMFGARGNQ